MEKENPLSVYKDGLNKVNVFNDRVEIGIIMLQSCQIGEIKAVMLKNILGITFLRLLLHNGSESKEVSLSKKNSSLCKHEIECLIEKYMMDKRGPIIKLLCEVLGGYGTKLIKGDICSVIFSDNAVTIDSKSSSFNLKIDELFSLDIGGKGLKEKTFGFVGGGHSQKLGETGIGLAVPITFSSTNTTIHFRWQEGELFINTSSYTPEEAQIILSPVLSKIISRNKRPEVDITEQLEKLVNLKEKGLLTDDEFSSAKAKLLGISQSY